MSKKFYSLRIDSKNEHKLIDELLSVRSNYNFDGSWGIELVEEDDDAYIPFIDYFLSLLEGKYLKLKKIGIEKNDISIWMLYAYHGQCNMEISPDDMLKLGKAGITLCISCWEN
ncbi:MAG: hypothetical protein VB046_14410 [Paludibacter sp.]|nr:hypothetical protein [Paludibacter sp.]